MGLSTHDDFGITIYVDNKTFIDCRVSDLDLGNYSHIFQAEPFLTDNGMKADQDHYLSDRDIPNKMTQGKWGVWSATFHYGQDKGIRGKASGFDIAPIGDNGYPEQEGMMMSIVPPNANGYTNSSYKSFEETNANVHAICHAVNGTYGKGINPDKVGEMAAMLESLAANINQKHNIILMTSDMISRLNLLLKYYKTEPDKK